MNNEPQPQSPLVGLIMMLLVWYWLLKRLGIFNAFASAFWGGFWNRVWLGTLRTPTGSGLLEKLLGIVMVIVGGLIALAVLGNLLGHAPS